MEGLILSRSFISSFSSFRQGIPWAAVFALIIIAGLELFLRFTPIPDFYPSFLFPRHEASKKTQTFKSLSSEGYKFNTVFLGSSVVDMGLNPHQFNNKMAENTVAFNAFNFGINGAGPWVHLKLIDYLFPSLTDLKLIVYGICPVEINSGSTLFLSDQKNFLDGAYVNESEHKMPFAWSIRKFLYENFAVMCNDPSFSAQVKLLI